MTAADVGRAVDRLSATGSWFGSGYVCMGLRIAVPILRELHAAIPETKRVWTREFWVRLGLGHAIGALEAYVAESCRG